MSLNRILFIGMPGAGKGTQAKLLNKDFNLPILGTGDIIREAWKNNDPLISPYKTSIEQGGFLPDELIFELIHQNIQNLPKEQGYILDGAVRTLNQARFVSFNKLVNLIVEFNLPISLAKERISLRRLKEDRKDDSPEAVEKRFLEYYNKTFPAMIFLRDISSNLSSNNELTLYKLDASPSIEEVHKTLYDFIKKS
jgi:adenylate kinase